MTIGVHYIAFYSQKGLRNAFWVGLCLPKKNFKLASAPKPIISDVVHWWGAASWLWPPCGQLVGEAPPQKSGEKWCLGGDGISCSAPTPKGTRGRWCLTPFGTAQESKTRKAPHPPKTKDQTKGLGEKRGKKKRKQRKGKKGVEKKKKNHGTQDSRVVPHRGTNWAALRLTAQIGRDAVLSKSYGRGYPFHLSNPFVCHLQNASVH